MQPTEIQIALSHFCSSRVYMHVQLPLRVQIVFSPFDAGYFLCEGALAYLDLLAHDNTIHLRPRELFFL